MKIAVTGMIIAASIGCAAAAQTPAVLNGLSTEEWSIEKLDLDVEIAMKEPRVRVEGRMTLRLEADTSFGPVLSLNQRESVMEILRLSSGKLESTIVPYPPNPAVRAAALKFPTPFARGDTLEVTFRTESSKQSEQFVTTDVAVFASWVEFWYPVPATLEKGPASPAAPGLTRFRLPSGWRSVGNGSLVRSSVERNGTIEEWLSDVPAARSFVAAPFEQIEDVSEGGRTIRFFLLKERADARSQASALSHALTAMERRLGPYPYGTYNVAEVPEGISFAAASEQGFIMVRSSVLDDARGALPLFAHEAGHGWWGNLVRGGDPGSRMVTEALAQYGAVFAIEAIEGRGAMIEFLRFSREGYNPLQSALGYFHIWREGGDKPLSKLARDRYDHNLADSKGMWFYHMLRERVGDEIFFGTLRELIRDYSSRTNPGREMSLTDLRKAFLDASPDDRGLDAFMSHWLERIGAPVLSLDWWSIERGKKAEIHITQLQDGPPFQMPLEIAIHTADGGVIETIVNLEQTDSMFVIETAARPLDVNLDPHHRALIWRPEFGPRPKTTEAKP